MTTGRVIMLSFLVACLVCFLSNRQLLPIVNRGRRLLGPGGVLANARAQFGAVSPAASSPAAVTATPATT